MIIDLTRVDHGRGDDVALMEHDSCRSRFSDTLKISSDSPIHQAVLIALHLGQRSFDAVEPGGRFSLAKQERQLTRIGGSVFSGGLTS